MRRWLEIGALVVLALCLGAVASKAQTVSPVQTVTVRVLPQAEVFADEFALSDIAELEGVDAQLLAQVAREPIGRAPLPGRSLRINGRYLQARLGRSFDVAKVRLIVPDAVIVMRSAQIVPAQEIEARVMKQAAADAGTPGGDLSQELLTELRDVTLPKGEVQWQIEQLGTHLSSGGARNYRVAAVVAGQEAWQSIVRVRQALTGTVVVAAQAIRAGETVRAGHLRLEERDLSRMRDGGYLSDPAQVIGQKAVRPIGLNELVRSDLVRAPADLSEGSRVTVLYDSPGLVLSVPGVAMVPARTGQFIPVRNLESGKIVYGVLLENDTVKVN